MRTHHDPITRPFLVEFLPPKSGRSQSLPVRRYNTPPTFCWRSLDNLFGRSHPLVPLHLRRFQAFSASGSSAKRHSIPSRLVRLSSMNSIGSARAEVILVPEDLFARALPIECFSLSAHSRRRRSAIVKLERPRDEKPTLRAESRQLLRTRLARTVSHDYALRRLIRVHRNPLL